VSTSDNPIIVRVLIIICIFAIALQVLRNIPHLVTNNLKMAGMIQTYLLIILILVKLTQSNEELSNNIKIFLQLILFLLVLARYIFIFSLLTKMLAIKYIGQNRILAKVFGFSIFKKFFNSISLEF
jgi:hypothetical protein